MVCLTPETQVKYSIHILKNRGEKGETERTIKLQSNRDTVS